MKCNTWSFFIITLKKLFGLLKVFLNLRTPGHTITEGVTWRVLKVTNMSTSSECLYKFYSSQALLFSWECELTLNMKKERPRTPLATTITNLKNNNRGLKEKLRRAKSTEKKINSRMNREVRMLFLSITNRNTPRVMKTKLRLRNKKRGTSP